MINKYVIRDEDQLCIIYPEKEVGEQNKKYEKTVYSAIF